MYYHICICEHVYLNLDSESYSYLNVIDSDFSRCDDAFTCAWHSYGYAFDKTADGQLMMKVAFSAHGCILICLDESLRTDCRSCWSTRACEDGILRAEMQSQVLGFGVATR